MASWKLCACIAAGTLASAAFATEPDQDYGEPYALAGNRIVFTTWSHVRPGDFDWRDKDNRSVFASKTARIGPDEGRFKGYDIPWGVRLQAEPAQRVGPILAGGEKPWEVYGIWVNTLMYDEGKYRLWGVGQHGKPWDENEEKANRLACYLESDDLKTWRRPSLGQVEFEGSRDNNLIDMGIHGTVFKDPVAPPEERYKSMWVWQYDRARFDQIKERRAWSKAAVPAHGKFVYAIMAAVSPDGLKWTTLPEPISFEVSDTHNICYYDQVLKKYVLYTRTREWLPTAKGHERLTGKDMGRRTIGRSESRNFREFPVSQTIIEPGNDMPPTDTLYTNGYACVPGAPDHHLMFPTVWHQATDASSFDLYTSHDGKLWSKAPGSPVFRTNTFGAWDGGSVFNAPCLFEMANGDWAMPYTGYAYPHKYPRGAWKYAVGLTVWPKGRLMGLVADEKGEFATAIVLAPAKTLRINAVTDRAGLILIEAADETGKPIAGRSFKEAIPIVGDHHWTQVKWNGNEELGVDAGKPVSLRFRLEHAKIYGLEFK